MSPSSHGLVPASAAPQRVRRSDPPDRAPARRWIIALSVWLLLAVVGSASGLVRTLAELAPTIVIPTLVAAGIALPLIAVARSPRSKEVLLTVSLPWLTLYNAWRIPAAFVFFSYGGAGLLPERFVINAAWGDLIAGVLAIITVVGARRLSRRGQRRAYLAFHIFSFGDFVVAVGTGVVLTLAGDPLMASLADFPLALIPLFGVPLTGALSLIALWRLTRRDAGSSEPTAGATGV